MKLLSISLQFCFIFAFNVNLRLYTMEFQIQAIDQYANYITHGRGFHSSTSLLNLS